MSATAFALPPRDSRGDRPTPGIALTANAAGQDELLPPGALGEGLRTLATTGSVDLGALAVLAVWTAVGTWLAARWFRWD